MNAAKQFLIQTSAEGISGALRFALREGYGRAWPDLMQLEDVVARLYDGLDGLLPDALKKQVTGPRGKGALWKAGAVQLRGGERIEAREGEE